MRTNFKLLLLLVFLVSCGKNQQISGDLQVIPGNHILKEDDRSKLEPNDPVASKIVFILTTKGEDIGNCTGSLIAEDLVLTNAHCLSHNMLFVSKAFNHPQIAIATATEAYIAGKELIQDNVVNDWAILRISAKWGKKLGYFGVFNRQPTLNYEYKLLAFHGDKIKHNNKGLISEFDIYESKCSLVKYINYLDIIEHDCDMAPGASGGPILGCVNGKCSIAGLNSAEFTYQELAFQVRKINFAISPIKFAPTTYQLK